MEWQPIETAPRDGTEVDLWCIGPPEKRFEEGMRVAEISWDDEFGWWGDRCPESWFTHWMPLPDPPRAALED